jgi:hypothetical protein
MIQFRLDSKLKVAAVPSKQAIKCKIKTMVQRVIITEAFDTPKPAILSSLRIMALALRILASLKAMHIT